jgi:putative PIN family toxin of toxin-antitoxin system
MKLVLDTNVLVSGLLNPFGAPGQIVRLVAGGGLRIAHDARILSEYREVLAREKFGFAPDRVEAMLDLIVADGETVAAAPLHGELPDPDDEMFLEVALAARADALVTGNLRHFPPARRAGVRIVSPQELIRLLRTPGDR